MYHPPSKKKQIATRFIIYGFMTISVVALVTLLVLFMLGFRLDSRDGTIEQAGFMQFSTAPSDATIEIDGKVLGDTTTAKSSVLPGEHEFVMWREGYETWRKSLTIEAGTLNWLNYARLIPKERPVVALTQFDELADTLASPGGRFMLAQPAATTPSFSLIDLRGEGQLSQTTLTLPEDSYAEADNEDVTHRFEIKEWDQSGRYILLTHRYDDQTEWLVLDREDAAETVNISTSLSVNIDDAHLVGTSGNILYARTGGEVRKLDVASGTISRPYVSDVASFKLYGSNIITYVSRYDKAEDERTIGFVREGDRAPHVLRTVSGDADVPLNIVTSRYFNQDYIAISEGSRVDIMRGQYPTELDDTTSLSDFASFDFSQDIRWLEMSGNGRFVLAQTGGTFTSYDLERQTTSPEATIAGDGTAQKLRWLDDYYVWSDRGSKLVTREYDGANQHTINDVAPGYDATLSQNGTYIYSIGRTDDGYQLQRVQLILDN